MTRFSTTTAFALMRRVAVAGFGTPSIYLLDSSLVDFDAVRSDLIAEAEIHLRAEIVEIDAADMEPDSLRAAVADAGGRQIPLIILKVSNDSLIEFIDRNVVLFMSPRPVLLLAASEVAGRMLGAAPNLRSRITDVLSLRPDEALELLRG